MVFRSHATAITLCVDSGARSAVASRVDGRHVVATCTHRPATPDCVKLMDTLCATVTIPDQGRSDGCQAYNKLA
jgi:hypothetical protein